MKINCSVLRRLSNMVFLVFLLAYSISSYATPSDPQGFHSAVYSRTTAELFWLRSSGDPIVVGYELTKNGELLGVFDALSYVDRTLVSGSSYEYTITAIDAQGARSGTVATTVRIPASSAEQIASLQQEVAELRRQLEQSESSNGNPSNADLPAVPVMSTGQVTSYAFGDDGDFQTGLSVVGERFIDNNNGTFTDTLTGLTWLGHRNCIVERTWASALEYANNLVANSVECAGLNDDSGAGDWRLPNIKELYSLVDISDDGPALANGIPYTGNWSDYPAYNSYWSSSSFQPVPNNNAFVLDAGFGLIRSWAKSSSEFYVWPVRVE